MGSVRTSIIGRPRPSPEQRRATNPYTLDWDEPIYAGSTLLFGATPVGAIGALIFGDTTGMVSAVVVAAVGVGFWIAGLTLACMAFGSGRLG